MSTVIDASTAQSILEQDINDLEGQLGLQILGLESSAEASEYAQQVRLGKPLPWKELTKMGRSFLGRNTRRLRKAVCQKWDYCSRRDILDDPVKIMLALIPVVGAALPIAGPVAGLSVITSSILVKRGLNAFCRC